MVWYRGLVAYTTGSVVAGLAWHCEPGFASASTEDFMRFVQANALRFSANWWSEVGSATYSEPGEFYWAGVCGNHVLQSVVLRLPDDNCHREWPNDFCRRAASYLKDKLLDHATEKRGDLLDAPMTVVGHVEQLHLSQRYQKSDTLTCVTCHDPHGMPGPKERAGYYKAICASCHPPARCTVSPARRQRESPDNNCAHCHMPAAPTEVPHLAFTHHRIGARGRPGATKDHRAPALCGTSCAPPA